MELPTIPIASLSPNTESLDAKSIHAIVTLIWPYSSSTRSAALLLAEPDFRLRKHKGQVRVLLRGPAAKAVAETKIGIGDEVTLHLDGAQWVEDTSAEDVVRTPGQNVDWELRFRRRLLLQISRDSKELAKVDVDSTAPSPEPEKPAREVALGILGMDPLSTPLPPNREMLEHGHQFSIFSKHSRLSGDSLTFSPYDPFAESDVHAKKRARRSWGNVGHWTLSNRTPSPEKDEDPFSVDADLEEFTEGNEGAKRVTQHAYRTPTSGIEVQRIVEDESRHDAPESSQDSQYLQMQYTQELVEMVAGDTEPDEEGESTPEEALERHMAGIIPSRDAAPPEQEHEKFQSPISSSDGESVERSLEESEMGEEGDDEQVYTDEEDIGEGQAWSKDESQAHMLRSEESGKEGEEEDEESFDSEDEEGLEDNEIGEGTFQPIDQGSQAQPIVLSDSDDDDEVEEEGLPHRVESASAPDGQMQAPVPSSPRQAGTEMLPPSRPTLQMPPPPSNIRQEPLFTPDTCPDTPRTPEINPITSASLPIPSPFPGETDPAVTSYMDQYLQSPEAPLNPLSSAPPDSIAPVEGNRNLSVPKTKDRKARTSSSSSYKKENGPFGEHFRAQYPFGLDGVTWSATQVIVDDSTDSHPPMAMEFAEIEDREPVMSSTLDTTLTLHAPINDPENTWQANDWVEPPPEPSDAVQILPEAAEDCEAGAGPPSISSKDPSKSFVKLDGEKTNSVPYDAPPPGTHEATVIDLGDGSSEVHEENHSEDPHVTTQASIESGTAFATDDTDHDAERSASKHINIDMVKDSEEDVLHSDKVISTLRDSGADDTISRPSKSEYSPDKHATNDLYPNLTDASEALEVDESINPDLEAVMLDRSHLAEDPTSQAMKDDSAPSKNKLDTVAYPPLATLKVPHSQPQISLSQKATATLNERSIPRPESPLVLTPDFSQPANQDSLNNSQHPQKHETETLLPPTPSLPQQAPFHTVLDGRQEPPSATHQDVDSQTQSPPSARKKRTRKRKSGTSNIPDVISPWFAPSRASLKASDAQDNTEEQELDETLSSSQDQGTMEVAKPLQQTSAGIDTELITEAQKKLLALSQSLADRNQTAQPAIVESHQNGTDSQPTGLRTPMSYYTPLYPAYLRPLLNNSSQHQSSTDGLIDVIAVVSSPLKPPQRAEKGPRDWHTTFSVADPYSWALKGHSNGEWPRGEVQVQCFMGGKTGKTLLPIADVGDVLLLTQFGAVSQKGKVGLINRGGGSGWCVWRFGASKAGAGDAKRPIWARKHGANGTAGNSGDGLPVEEMRGAPVEVGDEEQREALRLRQWWEGLSGAQEKITLNGNTKLQDENDGLR